MLSTSNIVQLILPMASLLQPPNARAIALLPTRPRGNHSSTFRKVEVLTNHYQVRLKPLDRVVIFRVKITPAIAADNRHLRSKIMQDCLSEMRNYIKNPVISGMCLYSTEQGVSKQWEVTHQLNNQNYTIGVKQVKIYDIRTNPKMLLMFLNNGLRNVMNQLGYVQIGKTGKFFSSKSKVQIDKLFMYSGYRSNFVHLDGGYFLRVDSAKKIVRNQTVLAFIDEHYRMNQDKDKEDRRNSLKGQLVDKIVMTNYGKTAYYKIIDICFKKLDEQVIQQKNISLKNYYLDKYQINIKNLSQPLLQAEQKNKRSDSGPLYLVPELCLMTGIPDNFDQFRRKKISEATIKDPIDKLKEIQGLMGELKNNHDINQLSLLGIDISHQLAKISAKSIPVPRLALGRENSVQQGKEAFFNLFNKPIFSSKHEVVCGIIAMKGTDLKPLISTFQSTSRNLQVNLKLKTYEMDPGAGVKQIQTNLTRAAEWGSNICCVVLSNNLKNQYKQIKQISLSKQEMITQMVTQFTLRKKNIQSIATKVLLQIIAKRGNTLWVPKTKCQISRTMLVAFDSAKGIKGTVLSVCATINSTFSSMFSHHQFCDQQTKFKSMVSLTLACIKAYNERNKEAPREILVYCNSCSGDQVSMYHEFYTTPLMDQLKITSEGANIKLTVIMVNTKNSERFFTTGAPRNVAAGTLIAEHLVSDNYDFFLVSQQSNKGSTVPNHYKVIFSNSQMEEGFLQELCFGQCFNYVNWTGSIKVPAILQYAKKCAKFNAEVLEDKVVPESLQNKLYFV